MVALLDRIKGSSLAGQNRSARPYADRRPGDAAAPEHRMIGMFHANYTELSFEEIAAPIPEMDEFLNQSRVVSTGPTL